jgi:hypothetical protein
LGTMLVAMRNPPTRPQSRGVDVMIKHIKGFVSAQSTQPIRQQAERVVPERIDLDRLAAARSHHPIADLRIHPGQRVTLRPLGEEPVEAQDPETGEFAAHADKTHTSFNRCFWNAAGGYLYEVVGGENGDDAAFRPNQIFAMALEHPVLDREYWEAVVTAVHAKLVTPVGLRSLAPGEPDCRAISATCAPAMPPITRHGVGLADRPVH